MITKITRLNMRSAAAMYLAMTLACLHFGTAFAQNDPFGPQPKNNAPTVVPTDPLKIGAGIKFDSVEQLPPGLKEYAKKQHAEMRSKGYIDASDPEVTSLKNFPKLVRPLSSMESNLKMKLSSFDAKLFDNLKFEGIVPEGPTPTGPWTSVSRIYTMPNGGIIRIFEWDYVADGGGVNFQQEMVNELINGRYQAILAIKKSAKGNASSTLTWATERKYYTLSMTGHVRGNGMYNRFMALANSIRD
ncbi:MAG: hypothetical protein Q8R69_16905 [Telluria sp.]|nr:hypothetical protein [Telluria sp.]